MSRSFTAGWVPEAVVLRESGQADLGLWHTVLLGSLRQISVLILGSLAWKQKASAVRSQRSVSVSIMCVWGEQSWSCCIGSASVVGGDPSARTKCLVQFPELQWVNGGDFYKILYHHNKIKKNKNHIIVSPHSVSAQTDGFLPQHPTSSSSTHTSCSWVGFFTQCKL